MAKNKAVAQTNALSPITASNPVVTRTTPPTGGAGGPSEEGKPVTPLITETNPTKMVKTPAILDDNGQSDFPTSDIVPNIVIRGTGGVKIQVRETV